MKGVISKDGKYFRVRFNGNVSCKQLLDWLYSDSWFYMKRKYEKYLSIPKPVPPKYRYKGIYRYHLRYGVRIKGQYVGLFSTVKEAVEAYNKIAITQNIPLQVYKGEDLHYEKHFVNF